MAAPQQQPGTCREAIRATWPTNLQELAILTMASENGSESPVRVSGLNYNGSRDYGCFQINNFAHPSMFPDRWSDPAQNALYAYQHIFASRGNWSAWYAVCSPNRQPLKAGIWCN